MAGLTAATAALALQAGAARAAPGPIWLGCRSDPEIGDQIAAFDGSGAVRMALPLPARGHAMALHPGRDEAVVFARRPGSFAVAFAPERGLAIRRFDSPANRHFHGHGVYDPTGRLLIATENDREHPRGVLGIYDAEDGYRRIGEIESHGIQPHQVLLMPDGHTLAAANGGIVTGGADGREKLNLDTMAPVLAYVELGSGKLLEARHMPPELHHLSIRHLAVATDGRLAAGMQWEGDEDAEVPLVGIDDGSGLKLLEMPPSWCLRWRTMWAASPSTDGPPRRCLLPTRQHCHLLGRRRGAVRRCRAHGRRLRRRPLHRTRELRPLLRHRPDGDGSPDGSRSTWHRPRRISRGTTT